MRWAMKYQCILGISGIERTFAVSLFRDGAVAFAIEEDKLRRFRGLGMRHLTALGSRAIDLALAKLQSGIRAVDQVAYVAPLGVSRAETEEQCAFVSEFLRRYYGFSPPVTGIDHVAAHLAFERAVHCSAESVLYVGRSRAVYSHSTSSEYDFDRDFTIVSFVQQWSEFLGMELGRIHHLESMARFGKPRFIEQLDKLLEPGFDPQRTNHALKEITGGPRLFSPASFAEIHYDFAASVHRLLCMKVCDLIRSIPAERRSGPVALSGGVFQSWSLNDAIAQEFPETRFLVSFAPGDPSCAVGGPLVLSGYKGNCLNPFLGPKYNRGEIKAVLDNCKAAYELCSYPETLEIVCDALAEGKMVGWFSGPCEFGYRALGARSVFANPENPYACDNLSSFLKSRARYLTYAVAMKDCNAPIADSPHLSRSTLLPQYFGDSRVRIQTVSRATNPILDELLSAFQKKTGVSALLNTSLNYFDEPIACTPRDALKTFYASGLDMLVMEGFVLRKS